MSDQTEKYITLTVEGVESEHGHIRADEFLDQLTHLLTALNGIDRVEGKTGSPKLYYRIVDAKHTSPLCIRLEPVVKKGQKVERDYVQRCHSRFFKELTAIRRMEPVSPDIESGLLEHLRDIAIGIGQDFKSATISNGHEKIELDAVFEKNLSKLITEEDVSYGRIEGTLDAVNIHGETKRFWIYPKVGPQRVRCDFLPGTSEQLRSALGHFVYVIGLKFFRPPTPFPFRIKVKDFGVISGEKATSISELRGIAPEATGEMSSVEFVRKIRNEWD